MKYIHCIILLFLHACSTGSKNSIVEEEKHLYTNDLAKETSPYLLQHAHNPVDWKPWNTEVLELAKKQNKLLIISIGYAACHWCHVMENESFEDQKVATIMNSDYINIKVDREERPDVDQVYMSAVQLMTGSGGWPLNVVTLPDGRPIWGGTYFAKGDWIEALEQLSSLYEKQPEQLREYADKLEEGIKSVSLVTPNQSEDFLDIKFIKTAVAQWSTYFDHKNGGTKRAPKFMMPNNYQFLLRYAYQQNDAELKTYVINTLDKISYGGVFDHIGGGFARYAMDNKWHIPHFEKMLYDNAQLVSLYADAYLLTKNDRYKKVVYQTLEFVERELSNHQGVFYSSLDADSLTDQNELEEGAFYTWTEEELKKLLPSDYELFALYYNINSYGYWEKGNYVLTKRKSDEEIAEKSGLSLQALQKKVSSWSTILLKARSTRSRPRLDDKSLTSWNAMMCKAYTDAYRVFREKKFLKTAITNAHFLLENQVQSDYSLLRTYKNGKSSIHGYLEDYASLIEAFITIYQSTFDPQWLNHSTKLTDYVFEHFYDEKSGLFYFTSHLDPKLLVRTLDYTDNVIPSSNSIMAKNLFMLYYYTDNQKYLKTSRAMLHTIQPMIQEYGSGYSNWLDVALNYSAPYYEIAIVGDELFAEVEQLNNYYIPNKLIAGSTGVSELPLLKNRHAKDQTLLYLCVNKSCKIPTTKVSDIIQQIQDASDMDSRFFMNTHY